MNDCDDIVKEFLIESYENLDRLDRDLVELEKHPSDREILASIFRTIHTIKGTSGFLGFSKLESVAHVGESLLARLRDGQLSLTLERTTALLTMVDAVRRMLADIEASGQDGNADHHALIAELTRLQQPSDSGAAVAVAKKPEAGKSEVQKLEMPKSETPKSETSQSETKESKVPDTKPQEAKVQEAKVQESKAQETKPPQPQVQQPVTQEPVAGKNSSAAPAAQAKPVVDLPSPDQPPLDRPPQLVKALEVREAHAEAEDGAAGDGATKEVEDGATKEPEHELRQQASSDLHSTDSHLNDHHANDHHLDDHPPNDHHPNDHHPNDHPSRTPEGETSEARAGGATRESIRVDVGLLDKLMNLVGELVLARNQILQFTKTTEETNLVTTGQRLNLIATELQESVMKTRMQPIGNIWSRFPRTVRDVAVACGKQVRIVMEGQETELDKTLIEAIKDPMTHLVRNAVDHGIERAEVRQAAGKDPQGLLLLRAYHEGGQVNVEITDDGAGLNLQKVVQKAVQKGLITVDQAAKLSDREAANLIFLPGLSTAEKVTNVSGRGVGMDVVKTNIERIGGTVDLQSIPGKSTTVKVKIPLTLAIVPALIVACGGQRYAIPQASLLELVGLEDGEARAGVESIHGAPVYRLRGSLLPLVHLKQALKIGELNDRDRNRNDNDREDRKEPPTPPQARTATAESKFDRLNIVVLQADGERFGLVVDEISDTEEIVVKPLGKHLKHTSVFAGAAIMGDGKVALILDVLGLAQHAHVVAEEREHSAADAEGGALARGTHARESRPLLLFQHGASGRMAIDLTAVARLEEFSAESLEIAGDQETVQYRGQIMPLVRLSETLQTRHAPATAKSCSLQVVVVHAGKGRNVGLVVDRILDIVDEAYALDPQTARHGVLGSAVIQQRITDLVDVSGLIASVQPAYAAEACVS